MSTVMVKCQWRTCKVQVDSGHASACLLHDAGGHKDPEVFLAEVERTIDYQQKASDVQDVDLSGVVFPVEANFSKKTFKKKIDFGYARFLQGAYFTDATFEGEAYFSGAEFNGVASFENAEFAAEAYFRDARFHGATSFVGVQFLDKAYFRHAEFTGSADFWNVIFKDAAYFWNADFAGGADFWHAEFRAATDFWGVQFGGDAYFTGATFRGDADFTRAQIKGAIYFIDTEFPQKTKQTSDQEGTTNGVRGVVRFHSLLIEDPQAVRFEGVDLFRVSFLRSDVSQVRFVFCTWAQKRDPLLLWPFPWWRPSSARDAVFDELDLDEQKKEYEKIKNDPARSVSNEVSDKSEQIKRNRRLIAEVYRQMRINLESTHQYKQAGDFYFGQMEMRRQDPEMVGRFYTVLLSLYRYVTRYGESYWRPLLWYAFILSPLFALVYWALGVPYAEGWFTALTAGALFQEIPSGIKAWEKLLVPVNMLFNIALLGSTVVALGRHFRR